jgi:hypothetical protein
MSMSQQPPPDYDLATFVEQLRQLRAKAGGPSLRTLEAAVHYSRTTISDAINGKTLPSLPVTLALASFLGGDQSEWERRWHAVRGRLEGSDDPYAGVAPAGPAQVVRDGADPDAAGCHDDARTVHARKIAMTGRHTILGQVELRYSSTHHAAWGRFAGYEPLKHLAHRQSVDVLVAIERVSDAARLDVRDTYWFDYHWCDLLVTDGCCHFIASASIFIDGTLAGAGQTDTVLLD